MQVLSDATVNHFLTSYWNVRQHMFRELNPILRERHGLELSDFFVLLHIHETDQSPSELADTLQIPAHGVSRKLDALQKDGLITRRLHPEDARKRVLALTKKGEETLRDLQITVKEEVSTLLGALEPKELEQLLNLLEKLG